MKIAMVCPVGIAISPDALRFKSLGGSETAFLCLGTELAKLGHEVHLYAPLEESDKEYPGDVYFHQVSMWRQDSTKDFDVAVFSRDVSTFADTPTNAKLRIYWLHDMPASEDALKNQIGNLWYIDKIFVLSDYHQASWTKRWDLFKYFTWKTRNGVDHALISKIKVKKEKLKFFYSSCPERGLSVLLKTIWPRLLTVYPEAHLYVCGYDVPAHIVPSYVTDMRLQLYKITSNTKNCHVLGSLPKYNLYSEMKSSTAVLYPCDFPEISCITAMEAMACGTPIVATSRFALPETLPPGYRGLVDAHPKDKDYGEIFLRHLDNVLNNYDEVVDQGLEFSKQYDWSRIAKEWEDYFKDYLSDSDNYRARTISCCMIVKDEEDNISGAIKSVAPFVDEVRILDTGSTDDTISIIENLKKKYETPIYLSSKDYGTDFSFDVARTDSIADTNADMILWLDADERIVNGKNLKKYVRNKIFNGFIIRQHQLSVDMPVCSEEPVRMFRNMTIQVAPFTEPFKLVKFVGVIHEHPEFGINDPVYPVLCIGDVDIAHYGYINEGIRREKVRSRNLQLLLKDRAKWPSRLLGKVLVMRDLIHMFEWAYENGTINIEYLARCIAIYKENFMGKELEFEDNQSAVWIRSFEWYQKALKYSVKFNAPHNGDMPFCARLLLSVRVAGVPDGGDSETRWFINKEEFNNFIAHVSSKATKQVQMELDPFL